MLRFTGKQWVAEDREIALEAREADQVVTVMTSMATIEAFGLAAIRERASIKYQRGLRAEDDSIRIFMADLL